MENQEAKSPEMLESVDVLVFDIQDVVYGFIHIFIQWPMQWKLPYKENSL